MYNSRLNQEAYIYNLNQRGLDYRETASKTNDTFDTDYWDSERVRGVIRKFKRNHSETEYEMEEYNENSDTDSTQYIELVNKEAIVNKKLQELDNKILELKKERIKFQTINIEYNKMVREQSRAELFYENVRRSIEALETPVFRNDMVRLSKNNKEYVLTLADIHGGSKFKSENNEYSMEICKERFTNLFSYMIDYIKEHDIKLLKVICLGDDIEGILRISDLKLNETSVVEATVFISKLIASFLNDLSNHTYIEYYHVPTANHSQTRNLGTKASELAMEDLEYVIGNYIKDLLIRNNRVTVNTNFGHEYITIPIFNYSVIALHGHQIKDIKSAVKDLSMLHRKFYDFVFMAHFHSSSEIVVGEGDGHDTEVLVCPSFVGSCPFSDRIMKGSKASCKIYVFDEKNGHIGTDKIILN